MTSGITETKESILNLRDTTGVIAAQFGDLTINNVTITSGDKDAVAVVSDEGSKVTINNANNEIVTGEIVSVDTDSTNEDAKGIVKINSGKFTTLFDKSFLNSGYGLYKEDNSDLYIISKEYAEKVADSFCRGYGSRPCPRP